MGSVEHPFRTSLEALVKSAVSNNCRLDDQMMIVEKAPNKRQPNSGFVRVFSDSA